MMPRKMRQARRRRGGGGMRAIRSRHAVRLAAWSRIQWLRHAIVKAFRRAFGRAFGEFLGKAVCFQAASHAAVAVVCRHAVGDFVARGGDDVQVVRAVNDAGDLIEAECVVAPANGWCAVGEREWNLMSRYQPVQHP